ncbi:MAG: DUF1365 domain-containing protein [Verrucomicrobia bacterium]|nr:DUF1365 domain-containing protein [Verrucomicrobiota bacterium]MCH8511352.1 DUF1365 domain-containing protein [Kiritimatiellia bacterium]
MNSQLMRGAVAHERLHPVNHRFRTPVGFCVFDLAELDALDREVRGFGYNRFAPVSLRDRDFLDGSERPLREKLEPWIESIHPPRPVHRIRLVTAARWWGKVFNPVSFFILEDETQIPMGLIAEVNNTFGDRHVYAVPLVRPEGEQVLAATHAKEFHVSPFNDMKGDYRFTLRQSGQELYVGVDLYKNGEKFLLAWIEGTGIPLTSAALLKQSLRHPLQPWLTLPKIIWQAIFLKYKHKLPVFKRPEPTHPNTLMSRKHFRT